ncbi:hypothetical protein QT970_09465, partial [Microcoleus sp. herbarium8]|uniref:hypothetical protein n=1 Tax=Microcoleus sp. herbarium8 TaxID=3055436 RepID=UPI002FD22B03
KEAEPPDLHYQAEPGNEQSLKLLNFHFLVLIYESETGFLAKFYITQPEFSEKPGFFHLSANTN